MSDKNGPESSLPKSIKSEANATSDTDIVPSRRSFMRKMAVVGIGAQALVQSGSLNAAVAEAKAAAQPASGWPAMSYRTLGRTGHKASRLIYGCGAALSSSRADDLLNRAYDSGVNTFDVGTSRYYDDAEKNLSPFLKTRRDQVFLISKAMLYLDADPDDQVSAEDAQTAATRWLELLDESLQQLSVDHVDAYYVMGANNPSVLRSEELLRAFDKAKQAGKTRFIGVSTHENAQNVLTAAADSGAYDLAMLAITPAGWYDWANRNILDDTPSMKELQPVLEHARAAGMGLIGMKAGRLLAGRGWLGRGNAKAFDQFYDDKLKQTPLSDFQRSYAYVLENGMDAVNADIQGYNVLRENFVAAATSSEYFA